MYIYIYPSTSIIWTPDLPRKGKSPPMVKESAQQHIMGHYLAIQVVQDGRLLLGIGWKPRNGMEISMGKSIACRQRTRGSFNGKIRKTSEHMMILMVSSMVFHQMIFIFPIEHWYLMIFQWENMKIIWALDDFALPWSSDARKTIKQFVETLVSRCF